MSYKIKLFHLYPDAMNLYGDLGNVQTLKKRCEWRDIEFEVVDVKIGTKVDFKDADIIFMGGGQDRGQTIIGNDLVKRGGEIKDVIDDGTVALTICGGFQLFGKYFKTSDGTEIPGISVFEATTEAGESRLIGNVVVDITETIEKWPERKMEPLTTLVGFENHSGITKLGRGTKPLGMVLKGFGNLGDGTYEGAVYKNAYGTYLHGSLLPKNPHFADHLIRTALKNRYGVDFPLEPLNDELEILAHERAIDRAETAKTLSL
jgi:lipid II isoglutaminyl synthase (glutamine-hydrolysing)